MRKCVIFDLDGTLTRSEEGIWNCVKYAAEKLGFPEPDAPTLRKFIGPPLGYSFREYMGMDDMREVGPKGHFLGQESTVKRNLENWESALEDRNEFDRWKALGGTTMGQRANALVKDIIENGKLNMMDAEKDAQIVAILERIDKAEKESMG